VAYITPTQEPGSDERTVEGLKKGFEIMRWVVQTKIAVIEKASPPPLGDMVKSPPLKFTGDERREAHDRRRD